MLRESGAEYHWSPPPPPVQTLRLSTKAPENFVPSIINRQHHGAMLNARTCRKIDKQSQAIITPTPQTLKTVPTNLHEKKLKKLKKSMCPDAMLSNQAILTWNVKMQRKRKPKERKKNKKICVVDRRHWGILSSFISWREAKKKKKIGTSTSSLCPLPIPRPVYNL